jgi:hypothetical protein
LAAVRDFSCARFFSLLKHRDSVMPAQRYFPQSEAERIVWLNQYAAKLPAYAAPLGLSQPEADDTLADIKYYVWILHTWYPATQQDALQATQVKTTIASGDGQAAYAPPPPTQFNDMPPPRPPGVLNRLFNQVQRKPSADPQGRWVSFQP